MQNQLKRILAYLSRAWPTTRQSILWSSIIALVAVGITFLALAQTKYVYIVDSAISNGQGPYESVVVLIAILLALVYWYRIWLFAQRAFCATQITAIDRLVVAVVVWGVGLWFAAPWYSRALPSIDWQHLSGVITLSQLLWALGLVLLVARLGFGFHHISTYKPPAQKPRLRSDNPISSPDEDLIGRSNIVSQIVSVVRDFDSEGALVVAVTGEWGTGKTTVLRLAHRQLREEKDIILVDFDPWYFSDCPEQSLDTLLKRFFDSLDNAISPRVFRPSITKALGRYYKAIAPVLEKAPIKLDFLFDEDRNDLVTVKEELNDVLKALEAKIVVLIDDLDRMDGREIAYVFKLIRLCANFDRVVYIVAFDSLFVKEQLEKEFGSKAKDYMDKIIQLELPLPKVEPIFLDRIFQTYLSETEQQLDVVLLKDRDFVDRLRSVFYPHIIFLLNNIRLVKLLCNRYMLVLPTVSGEINYFDLLTLEIVRLRYPQIYESIYCHPEHFTYQNNINWAFPGDEGERAIKFFDGLVAGLDEESKEAVLSLLGSVFNSVQCCHRKWNVIWDESHDPIYRERKSAAHPYYFPRYFYLTVQQGTFPDVIWDNFIGQINTSREDEVRQSVDAMVGELIRDNAVGQWLSRMRLSIPKINCEQIPALLLAITNRSKEFSEETAGFIGLGDYRLMIFLVVDLLKQLESERIEEVAIELINSCPDVEFLRRLVYWFEPEGGGGKLPEPRFAHVDYHKLKQTASDRLRKTYIEGDRNILTEAHHHGGVYALEAFLEPTEYRPYMQRLLAQDGRNALLLLNALISYGHFTSGIKTDTFRVLDYPTVKALVEPQQLLAVAERSKPVSEMSEDEAWAVDNLRNGIEKEARGETVEHISEFGPGM